MNYAEFRDETTAHMRHVDQQSTEFRDSGHGLLRALKAYRKLDSDAQRMEDRALREWILSEDATDRHHGVVFIHEYRVTSALPELPKLSDRLATLPDPAGRDERKYIEKPIRDIRGSPGTEGEP